VSAGLVGFLVILALVAAAVVLFRSMMKHMRRVPDRFDTDAPDGVVAPDADADQSSGRD
jgi:hypothetical protein